jgi:chloride channel 2
MGSSNSSPYEEEALRDTVTGDESPFDASTPVRRGRHEEGENDDSDTATETTGLYNVDEAYDESYTAASNRCTWLAKRLLRVIFSENWLFLIVLGLVAALVGFGIDAAIYYLFLAQVKLTALVSPWGVQYLVWILWSLIFSALAILPIILISSNASGSGIPEMKCILSGIELNRYLNFRTLVSKCLGLIMAYASGLAIGKEGPFVHIASILCSLQTKLPFFKYIRQNNAAYMQVLGAASAAGVTSAFGTPVGGVFFSMEVTSAFYHVENLWRAFFVSVAAKLLSVVLRKFLPFGLDLFEAHVGYVQWQLVELIPFGIMGIVFGVLSGVFVRLLTLVFRLSRIHSTFQTAWGQLARAALVCFIIALVSFPAPLMRNDNGVIIPYLGSALVDHKSIWKLALFCVAKFIAILFSVAFTGASAGVFGPVFVEGAFLGRLVGELMSLMFPHLNVSPTAYVIVGAAAFASGVTRTISTAIIVVELTMQVHLLLPVLVAVLLANFVGRMLSLSVYSVLIQAKDLPQMPRFKLFNQATSKTAGEIMSTEVQYLHSTANYREVASLVSTSDFPSFPLVDADGYFCGIVRRAKLTSALKHAGISRQVPSLGDFGQKVLDRAVKHWEEKNHPLHDQQDRIRTHLEPEDLERGLPKSLEIDPDTGLPSTSGTVLDPALDNQASFGRKAEAHKHPSSLASAIESSDFSSPSFPSSSSSSSASTSNMHSNDGEVAHRRPVNQLGSDKAVDLDSQHFKGSLDMLNAPVPFIFNSNSDSRMIDVDTTVLTISPDATVTKVHFMFTVLGLSHIFVVRKGKLLGLITRKDLIKAITSMNYER